MSDHDPLCKAEPLNDIYFCACEFIAKVRADERERILEYAKTVESPLAELRIKVEALRVENAGDAKSGNRLDRDFNLGKVFAYERVLALIDGSNDD